MSKIFAITVAVFFALSLAGIAIAEKDLGTYRGEVVAIDHSAKTLTVRADSSSLSPLLPAGEQGRPVPSGIVGAFTFSTDPETSVLMCNMSRDFSSISVGDEVNLKFGEENGSYIAKFIDISAPIVACNMQ